MTGPPFCGLNSALMFIYKRASHLVQTPLQGSVKFIVFGILLLLSTRAFALSPRYDLGFETQFYGNRVNPSLFPVLSAGMKFNSESEDATSDDHDQNEYAGDLKFQISPSHPRAFEISSRNLYWGEKDQSYESPLRFTFGRRLIGWTKLDELWGQGQFEPIDSWDRLRSFSQGLTGVFAYTETQKFNFRIFLSGIAFPETSPNVVIEDDHFAAEHPQAVTSAPQTFTLLNRATPLGYKIDIPSIAKILFRPSFAFMMETKREIPFFGKFVYGYLPLNYFPIALEASLAIPLDQIVVNLKPRLIHHHLYDAEVAYRYDNSLQFGLIALVDQPVPDAIPADYTTTPLSSSISWSPWVQYEIKQSKIILSQIWVFGGLESDVGPYADPNSSIFSSRILYRNATQLAFKTTLGTTNPHAPSLILKYIHEYSIKGDWLAGDFNYKLKSNVLLIAGADILSSFRDVSPDKGAEFLADMRPLGRIRLGVNYAF